MQVTVRIACPSGQHYGVRVKCGSLQADIPVGGVQTFHLHTAEPLTVCSLEEAPAAPAEETPADGDAE